jgi:hypothetical protein
MAKSMAQGYDTTPGVDQAKIAAPGGSRHAAVRVSGLDETGFA